MISIVIIAKNEAHIIGQTLQSAGGISDDIIVVDSGSTDGTQALCRQYKARVIETAWQGYGPTKNIGIDAARHDWILNLDADEPVDEELREKILKLPLQDDSEVFQLRRKNFFLGKWIRYGEWGNDKVTRLFNRKIARWDNAAVHEKLAVSVPVKTILLNGYIRHYTTYSLEQYKQKSIAYAKLNAKKYFEEGKKSSFTRRHISPVFSFIQNYLFRLGFLDGQTGFFIARTTARYTYLKYYFLKEMQEQQSGY